MPKTTPTYEFFARIWLWEDAPTEISTWCHELEPMDGKRQPVAEWAYQELSESHTDENHREQFNLPLTGNFQVVLKGSITGGYDSYTGEGHCDLCVDEFQYGDVPNDFKAWRWEKGNPAFGGGD